MNIEVHRSDECGDIVFKSTGNGFTVDCKKEVMNLEQNNKMLILIKQQLLLL